MDRRSVNNAKCSSVNTSSTPSHRHFRRVFIRPHKALHGATPPAAMHADVLPSIIGSLADAADVGTSPYRVVAISKSTIKLVFRKLVGHPSKLEKLTFEMRKATADKLRRMRLRLREGHDLPVTQQMIVEYLIDDVRLESLVRHFEVLTERLGLTESDLKRRRRSAYLRRKKSRIRP